jgi:hypothetical protein
MSGSKKEIGGEKKVLTYCSLYVMTLALVALLLSGADRYKAVDRSSRPQQLHLGVRHHGRIVAQHTAVHVFLGAYEEKTRAHVYGTWR